MQQLSPPQAGPSVSLALDPVLGGGATQQLPLDLYNNSLLALGLAGPAAAGMQGRALSTAEFLRLCSLPGAAELLPGQDG